MSLNKTRCQKQSLVDSLGQNPGEKFLQLYTAECSKPEYRCI